MCEREREMKLELERDSLCSSFSADSRLLKESLMSETCCVLICSQTQAYKVQCRNTYMQ